MQFPIVLAPSDVHLFRLLLASLDDLEKRDEGFTLFVCKVERVSIGYPAMDTSSSRIDP